MYKQCVTKIMNSKQAPARSDGEIVQSEFLKQLLQKESQPMMQTDRQTNKESFHDVFN